MSGSPDASHSLPWYVKALLLLVILVILFVVVIDLLHLLA